MRQNGFSAGIVGALAVFAVLASLAAALPPASAQETAGTCLIISGTRLLRNEPCTRTIATRINQEGRQVVDATHAWPAGRPTVLTSESETFLLDGEEAAPAGGTLGLSCVMNRRNEVLFCFFETP